MKKACEIDENETAGELHDKLSSLGAGLIVEVLSAIENGTVRRAAQNDSESSYAGMLDKTICTVDWTLSSYQVHNKVRGLSPWPVATAMLDGKKVKLHKTELCSGSGSPGEVISLTPLTVACGSGSVVIKELQLEGKRKMDSASFLNGHRLALGDKFE